MHGRAAVIAVDDGPRFGNLAFDKSFLYARRDDGKELKFTRAERAILLAFTGNLRKLLTRSQLLEALTETESDVSDRNVDYLISRLRTKLGDSARKPTMIATQYGEGYVWIAELQKSPAEVDALLVIGPVTGLDGLMSPGRSRAVLQRLQAAIDSLTARDQIVVVDENWAPDRRPGSKVRFSLDVSFYDDGVHLHCAAVLRDAVTRYMVATCRLVLDAHGVPTRPPDIEEAATDLTAAMWRHAVGGQGIFVGPQDVPLELRMHDTASLLTRSQESWAEMGEQIARQRESCPRDPQTNLMWAMHLYARILQNPAAIEMRGDYEAQIEAAVFEHLPALQDNPILMLGASKLLLFTGRGHLGLAERLAEHAFASSAAFAASFAGLGQIRMCRGNIASAVDLYDRGIDLAEPKSEFQVYLMVLKCAALLAAGDRSALDAACAVLYATKPMTRLQLGLFLAPSGPLAPDLEALLAQFDASRAQRAILYLYYLHARLFEQEDHRCNMMRGLLGHLLPRFGNGIVQEEVWRSVPQLACDFAPGNDGGTRGQGPAKVRKKGFNSSKINQ